LGKGGLEALLGEAGEQDEGRWRKLMEGVGGKVSDKKEGFNDWFSKPKIRKRIINLIKIGCVGILLLAGISYSRKNPSFLASLPTEIREVFGSEQAKEQVSFAEAIKGTELEALAGSNGLIEDEKSGLTVFQFGNADYIDVTNAWDIDMIRFGAIDPNFIFFEEQRGWLEEKAGGQLPDSLFGSQTPQEREQAYLQWLNIGRQRGFYSEAEYQVLKYRLNLPREIWYQAMWLSKETGDDDDIKLKAFNQEVNRLLTMLKQKGWDSTED
jgi:hypothetical protein